MRYKINCRIRQTKPKMPCRIRPTKPKMPYKIRSTKPLLQHKMPQMPLRIKADRFRE